MPALLGDFRHADGLPRALPSPPRLAAHVARHGIADLDQEVRLGAVEPLAVVEILFHQLDDARDGLRRFFRVGLELDGPLGRLEHDDRTGARRLLLGGRHNGENHHANSESRSQPFRCHPTSEPRPPTSFPSLPTFVPPIFGQMSTSPPSLHRAYTV